MAKILLNNPDDFSNEKKTEGENKPSTDSKGEITKAENISIAVPVDDYAVFPKWDVVPPDSIINPRIRRKS